MLRDTFGIISKNWTMYLVVVLATVAVGMFDELWGKTTSNGATSFMWSYLAMCVQGAVIYSESFTAFTKRSRFGKTFPYFIKTAALFVIALAMSLPIFAFLPPGLSAPLIVLIAVCAMTVAYVLVLSLAGTWPVSSITGVETGFLEALRRGVSRFLPRFGRIVAGTICPVVVSLLVFMVAAQLSGSSSLLVGGTPNILVIAASTAAACLQAVGVSYAAVVLARDYMSGGQKRVELNPAAA